MAADHVEQQQVECRVGWTHCSLSDEAASHSTDDLENRVTAFLRQGAHCAENQPDGTHANSLLHASVPSFELFSPVAELIRCGRNFWSLINPKNLSS